ncbi:hypothetical protein ONS95_011566 [Cadophora gregata]|uniref:uncharacterized protein n=1 Tax=Cadophora gregata TaxID=51156 RepID=UPI0026DB1A2F|nr:uncharacterized protein ONS95_011566 [Cadophora gregata]KAK0120160.1 hypothetical protein ONS95_011566 [Cadophora gregata]KAK0121186.1 hypothetical protein ONS96_011366 [Cadophora gregata f. sp. sojae]
MFPFKSKEQGEAEYSASFSDESLADAHERDPYMLSKHHLLAPRSRAHKGQLATFSILAPLLMAAMFSVAWSTYQSASMLSAALVSHGTSGSEDAAVDGLKLHHGEYGRVLHCEGDSTTLKARGCTFDLLVPGWIPNPCFDKELNSEYVGPGLHDYGWFTTEESTERIPQEVVNEGQLADVWTTWDMHIAHCEYTLKGMGRVLTNPNLGVHERHLDEEHVYHCVDVLAHRDKTPLNRTQTHIMYKDVACYVDFKR